MDRLQIIDAVVSLNANNPLDCEGDIVQLLEMNLLETITKYNLSPNSQKLPDNEIFKSHDNSPVWKYISLNLNLLLQLKHSLDNTPPDDVLGVQQNKSIINSLKQLICIGIRCNLIPKLPEYYKPKSPSLLNEDDIIMKQYERLAATTYALYLCIKCAKLNAAIVTYYFQPLLNAMYQIVYCPLKKPNHNVIENFTMTLEIYERLMRDRKVFEGCLLDLSNTIHKTVYTKETMVLHQQSSPVWFKKAVGTNLTEILGSQDGLKTITTALLENSTDYDPNDTTKTWKAVDVIIKLIISRKNSPEFSNICNQVRSLLSLQGERVRPFESIFLACTKTLHASHEEYAMFLDALLKPMISLTEMQEDHDVTDSIQQSVRLLHNAFIINNSNYNDLPLGILKPIINVVFRLFGATLNTSLRELNHQLNDILIKYLNEFKSERVEIYDSFFFNRKSDIILNLNTCLSICNGRIFTKQENIEPNFNAIGGTIVELLNNHGGLLLELLVYLMNCQIRLKEYFFRETIPEMETIPELPSQGEYGSCAINDIMALFNLLVKLAENKSIQAEIKLNPGCIVDFFHTVLTNAIDINLHMCKSSTEFRTVFVTIMVLQTLVTNSDELQEYRKLLNPLKSILALCADEEIRNLIGGIVPILEVGFKKEDLNTKKLSDVDLAIQLVFDPLLAIKGNGLIMLGKLVTKKDKETMERKNYVYNIFLLHLKQEDSFIYLAAIKGLAALGEVFPDLVLQYLTNEYSEKNGINDVELRMKIGEVLMRITNTLGDTASTYKSVLLNTFLDGSRDDDHLIRASSLSNLGEVCRVLGYKLGSIAIEVLKCVHRVIATDKAVETRRAAVNVIRQLFIGLKSELLTFLKDDIVEIYRTLKNIYKNDNDDVMRLQAQLALEELDDHMQTFVFPKPELGFEKKNLISKDQK